VVVQGKKPPASPETAAEARRLFNLHMRAIRPDAFHQYW
jgi:hypothetical protein